jgi:hypothetical protein
MRNNYGNQEELLMKEYLEFEEACRKNRSFPECKLFSTLEKELDILLIKIPSNFSTFRGRVYYDSTFNKMFSILEKHNKATSIEDFEQLEREHQKLEDEYHTKVSNDFFGFNATESFVNPVPNNITAGRCNHIFEPCLYTAENVATAISELKPLIHEKISVAEIITLEELNIIDLSFSAPEDNSNFLKNIIAISFLRSPVEGNKDAYIYTQAICSFIKKQGYDGIKYSSCQDMRCSNYAIFNYEKCKPINSRVYSVNQIKYTYEEKIFPSQKK